MTEHLFLTDEAVVLPNWRAAFANARRVFATQSAQQLPPTDDSIVWLDATTPDATEELLKHWPGVRTIALSRHPHPAAALTYLRLGCRGYCHTLATPDMLRDVAEVVRHGGFWVGPELIQQGLRDLRAPLDEETAVWEALTPREKQVAGCIVDGLSNKEICRHLDIEERTTKTHITAILRKAKVRDRLQLVVRLTRKSPANPTT